jgi:hypothetical protein
VNRRGRGARFTTADCPRCGEKCDAPDTSPDAHRVWAQRHADRTGHTTLVETVAVRSYAPKVSTGTIEKAD